MRGGSSSGESSATTPHAPLFRNPLELRERSLGRDANATVRVVEEHLKAPLGGDDSTATRHFGARLPHPPRRVAEADHDCDLGVRTPHVHQSTSCPYPGPVVLAAGFEAVARKQAGRMSAAERHICPTAREPG